MPRKAPFLTILFFLLLSPFSLSWPSHFTSPNLSQAETQINTQEPWVISENTTWTKQNSPYIITTLIQIEPQATLTIEPGTIIKLYSSDPNQQLAGFLVSGSLIASGTPQEPIVFTSLYDPDYASSTISNQNHPPAPTDWTGILTAPNSTLILNHTIVKYAGSITDKPQLVKANQVQAQATSPFPDPDKNYTGALNIGPQTTTAITNSQISDNLIGLFFQTSANNIISFSVHHNDILNNSLAGVYNPNTNTAPFDLTNNFWGHPTGPYHQQTNPLGQGNQVLGPITFTPFLSQSALTPPPSPPQPTTPDPVILIPGIMGSWKVGSKWQLDPILHTYDNLWQALKQADYQENKTLFAFPYQWRLSNQYTALLLKDKIQEIKNICHCPKVDIIAHSMGGLVARAYIENNDYQNDVDQLIFLATPHQGAPESYLAYEGGYLTGSFAKIKKFIFQTEAVEHGYLSLAKYIRERIPSTGELLPTNNYLLEKVNNQWQPRIYPVQYPRNQFLETLNAPTGLSLLDQRVRQIINIYSEAKTAGASTALNFIQVRPDTDIYDNDWPDGEPVCLNSQNKDCFIDGPGDGTVPLSSLKYLPADLSIEINMADHRKIVTKAQKEVIRYLTGHYSDKEYTGPWTAIKRLLFIRVYSPVDLQVINPSGKKVGKDFPLNQEVNQIPGAFYSGFNTETEFITIINPQAGDYTVKLQGVANGEYKLGVDVLDNNNQTQTEENLIMGIISSSSQESFSFHYSSSSPTSWSATIKKEISFSDLVQDTKELYQSHEITKKFIYRSLLFHFKHLEKIYNFSTKIHFKKWQARINKMIKFSLQRIKKRLKFYPHRHWLTQAAYEVLVFDLDSLLNY